MRGRSDKPSGQIFYKIPGLLLLRIVKIMKTKEILRKCHRPEETKETGQLNVVSWIGFWDRKSTLMEKLVKSKST